MRRLYIKAACSLALTVLLASSTMRGQSVQAYKVDPRPEPPMANVRGVVRDSLNHPVAGATVCLQANGSQILTVHTDSAGAYLFPEVRQGVYTLSVEMAGYDKASSGPLALGVTNRTVDLSLYPPESPAPAKSSEAQAEFFDEPQFTVAGVADTTNLGGHGSDTVVRNREALAQATASLSQQSLVSPPSDSSKLATERSLREAAARQPKDFDTNFRLGKLLVDDGRPQEGLPYLEGALRLNPNHVGDAFELALAYAASGDYARARSDARVLLANRNGSRQENAELHHLLAEADEQLGDPLEAVREYQRAAELNPSETNFFDWGAELLIHHASDPAIEVFTKGNRLFPRSVRMLAGLGASWYSNGSFDQAAQRFSEASDLNPDDPNPYLFMGRIQTIENTRSPEIEERLARFVRLHPQNPWANYYYAVSLKKGWKSPEQIKIEDVDQVKSLLQTTVHLDPKFGLAYLQLGILYSQQKDFPKAISAWQEAVAATPELEEAHYRLAELYRKAGEISKARAELQLYEQIEKEKMQESERQRHEIQQFIYQLKEGTPTPQLQ
jgi:tetratricopeptide (TPR) repeat protein